MQCHQCGSINLKQHFCGVCGAPLALDAFIARQVKVHLEQQTQHRDLVERESAVRIFEKAYGWAKMLAGVAVVVMVPLAAFGIYKWSDLFSTINNAKQSVSNTAEQAQYDLVKTASDKRKTIEDVFVAAQTTIANISSNNTREGRAVVRAAETAKSQIVQQTTQVQADINGLHTQVEAARKLQPEMVLIREELTRQQKVLSSSEEFAKNIFRSHRVDFFQPDQTRSDHYKIVPRQNGNGATVYLLLSKVPVAETLQLQYHIFSQPINSYMSIHNLVIFSWGDPADTLKSHQISVSYFPDNSDREIIRKLSDRDGRAYADGEPLFRFGEFDPGFAGNKWVPVVQR